MRTGVQLSTLIEEVKIEAKEQSTASSSRDPYIKQLLNREQRYLATKHRWPLRHDEVDVPITAGTKIYTFPATMEISNIRQMSVLDGQDWIPMKHGIGDAQRSQYVDADQSWPPVRYEFQPDEGDTTYEFELWPVPSQPGSVRVHGQLRIVDMVNDTDKCLIDADVLVCRCASEILLTRDPAKAALLRNKAQSRIDTIFTKTGAGLSGRFSHASGDRGHRITIGDTPGDTGGAGFSGALITQIDATQPTSTYVLSRMPGSDDTARLIYAVANCPAGGRILIDRDFTFSNVEANELHLTNEGVTFDGLNHTIRFTNYRYSALQVRADDVTVQNLTIICEEAAFNLAAVSSGYQNSPARQRSAGVYVHDCNRVHIRNVHVDRFQAGIALSPNRDAPLVFYTDHRIFNCSANNVDQGIVATQCDRIQIRDFKTHTTARTQQNGSGVDIEPHSIYMTTSIGSDNVTPIGNGRVDISDCSFFVNHFDSFMKLNSCPELSVNNVQVTDGEIVMQVSDCDGASISKIVARDMKSYVANTEQGVHIRTSNYVTLTDIHLFYVDNENNILFRANTGADYIRFHNCGGRQRRTADTANSPFLVVSDYCEISNCYFVDEAAQDIDHFVDCSGDHLTMKYPRLIGLSRVGIFRHTDKNSQLVALANDIEPAFDTTAVGPAGSVQGWRTVDVGGGFNPFSVT